jgi:DNA-binding transcriptional ArsR family regulator
MVPRKERDADEVLADNSEGIAGLLGSVANPARVTLLTLMLRGEGTYSEMMAKTGLSKTAVANHLSKLVEGGLARRSERGRYALTVDGRELLSVAVSMYLSSARRADEERARLQTRYRRAFMGAGETGRRIVSRPAIYQPCWLSYTGAMAGCLSALGSACDATDVGGASGYSFIINVAKGQTCPSGPTATHVKTFKEMLRATESFGNRIEAYIYQHSYPAKAGSPTPRELEVVSKLFDRVRREVDGDRPVVVYGLAAPEYGIVNGYDGQSYIVSTYRSVSEKGRPEEPIPFHALNSPGCIDAFYFREGVRTHDDKAFLEEALSRASRFANAHMPVQKGYVAGLDAYDEWAKVLTEVPEGEQNYLGNSYTAACVAEARGMSAAYLKRLSTRTSASVRDHLTASAASYARAAARMEEFSKLFPFGFEGEMKEPDRRKGAGILREARVHEEAAIKDLDRVTG